MGISGWNIYGGILDPAGGIGEGSKGPWYQRLGDPAGAFQEGGMFGPANQAEIDPRDPDAVARQNEMLASLQAAAAGQGPSAATDQMMLGAGYGAAQAQGMAAGQTGISPAQAARMAQMGGMEQRARANEQAGILRAKEQQAAMQMYSDAVAAQQAQNLQEMGIYADLAAKNAKAREKAKGGLLSGAGALIGGLISDRRAKCDISELSDDAVVEFITAINPSRFAYKDPGADGAREGAQVGIMAQDIADTEIGRTFVKETENGLMLDAQGAVTALLAVVGALGKRLLP